MTRLNFVHKIVGAKISRVALALVLVGLGLWAFAPLATYRVSSSAFINSEVMRITAPIPGYLSSELPPKGQYISEPHKLTLIKSYANDRQRLVEMEGQQSTASERAEFAKRQLAELATFDAELAKRMQVYRGAMRNEIRGEITEVDAERKGCLAEVGHRQEIGTIMQGLADSGAASRTRSAEVLATKEATMTRCNMAAGRLERLKIVQDAIENGVFIRDSANDVPYSQQQRERLFLRRQELELEAFQNSLREKQLGGEIGEERRRIAHLGQYDLTLPVDYIIWSVPASPGSVVVQGQTVLDLADCKNRFVAVELPEREFENIKPGDTASIRLLGSDERREGFVRQVRGSAARGDDRLFAAHVPVAIAGYITAEVSLPSADVRRDSNFCDIGRLAEVRFRRGLPTAFDYVRQFFQPIADIFKTPLKVAEQ